MYVFLVGVTIGFLPQIYVLVPTFFTKPAFEHAVPVLMVAAVAGVITEVARNRPRVDAITILRSIDTSIGISEEYQKSLILKGGNG
jgi:tetrahydromethanopterin S-methyltransferase subunit C